MSHNLVETKCPQKDYTDSRGPTREKTRQLVDVERSPFGLVWCARSLVVGLWVVTGSLVTLPAVNVVS